MCRYWGLNLRPMVARLKSLIARPNGRSGSTMYAPVVYIVQDSSKYSTVQYALFATEKALVAVGWSEPSG